ncbi:MAG: outer membrane beta-barrel protein [bacterium]
MKKLLVVSAIAALGLTSVAFAGGLPEEMPTAPAASSSDTGVYVGIEGGFGITNWKTWETDASSSDKVSKDNGFAGRAFVGYDINRYFALETGYSYFSNKAVIKTSGGVEQTSGIKTQVIDLYGKIKAPVVDSFDLYAKLGACYLMSNIQKLTSGSTAATLYKNEGNVKNFNVAFGAGADYAITPNVIANVEWLRNAGHYKSDDKYQPNTDAFMLGLRYKFDL